MDIYCAQTVTVFPRTSRCWTEFWIAPWNNILSQEPSSLSTITLDSECETPFHFSCFVWIKYYLIAFPDTATLVLRGLLSEATRKCAKSDYFSIFENNLFFQTLRPCHYNIPEGILGYLYSSLFQVDKVHFERDTFHKRLLLKLNSSPIACCI